MGEGQHVDDGPAAHVHGVAPLLVVHADVVLRLMEVEPGGLWGRQQRALWRRAGARRAHRSAELSARLYERCLRASSPLAGFAKTPQPILALAEMQPGCWWKRAPGGSINISEIIMCENVTAYVWINYTQDAHTRLQSSHDSAV